jgi:ABC-type transport system involved in cytochrome c biogenesis permease subunit
VKQRHVADNILTYALFMWMSVALFMTFFYAPIESEMGIVQKIFYFHVPLAWNAFLGSQSFSSPAFATSRRAIPNGTRAPCAPPKSACSSPPSF